MSARGRSTDHMYTYCAALRLEASHIRDWRTLMKKLIAITLTAALALAGSFTASLTKTADAAAYATKTNTQYTDTYTDTAVTKSFAKSKTKKVSKKTKTKHITVAKLNGTTLKYHKSTMNTNLKGNSDWEWENIVGYGKKSRSKLPKIANTIYLETIYTPSKRPQKRNSKNAYTVISVIKKMVLFGIGEPLLRS